ncbi:hypothetical protein [Schleiferilactobacillus shenzhenensis]|uniref:Uncharacterized protein n=1 Tax=Schleiferilactobacillus shenzhenensis LY-73 TaxID=1231336 RepID=U4TVF4_9LACO|nr:hypothetical protein [Schleiferilactobacillus shenzhenensis]ERL65367.1 hypothetical protein L248_2766 [Schleiferilactobacillus shenzhenensis LY-73]
MKLIKSMIATSATALIIGTIAPTIAAADTATEQQATTENVKGGSKAVALTPQQKTIIDNAPVLSDARKQQMQYGESKTGEFSGSTYSYDWQFERNYYDGRATAREAAVAGDILSIAGLGVTGLSIVVKAAKIKAALGIAGVVLTGASGAAAIHDLVSDGYVSPYYVMRKRYVAPAGNGKVYIEDDYYMYEDSSYTKLAYAVKSSIPQQTVSIG